MVKNLPEETQLVSDGDLAFQLEQPGSGLYVLNRLHPSPVVLYKTSHPVRKI